MASSSKSESSNTRSSERTTSREQKTKIHRDPFDDLLAEPEPSTPLFNSNIPSDRPLKYPPSHMTPLSPGSDFGAFVSGTSASSTLEHHPLIDFNSGSESQQSSPNAVFFDKFMDGAKERTGESERRILGEILEHENNSSVPWSKAADSDKETPFNLEATISDALNSSPTSDLDRNPFDTGPLTGSSPPPTLPQHTPSSSPSSSLTLPRKWMPNLLSHNTLPAYKGSRSDVPSRKSILPSLSHTSPFASHIFVPSTGAPGFAGDYHGNKSGFEFMEEDKLAGQLVLTGRNESTTVVLTQVLANQLRNSLPALSRLTKSWTLLYSLDQHGVSLQTLYSRCQSAKVSGTLLALRDLEDHVFGAWLGEPLRISPGAYYGSGESFLWRSGSIANQEPPQVYKWSGKNEYVALCESKFISFGGGDGKYGLYLDDNLTYGSSASCPTFDNDVLCSWGEDSSKTVYFECVGLEVWGIGN